jgi:hypothetical protein
VITPYGGDLPGCDTPAESINSFNPNRPKPPSSYNSNTDKKVLNFDQAATQLRVPVLGSNKHASPLKAGRLSRGEPSPDVTNPTEPALRLQVI